MHVDYEIRVEDFINGQTLAIRKSPVRLVRWTRLVLPLAGLGLLIFLIHAVSKQGFSWRAIPGAAVCLFFMATPLLNKRAQRKLYAKTSSMHGMLSLDVDDEGVQFTGSSFSSKSGWTNFRRFLEDEYSFLLYQVQSFNIIPKRNLSPEQITALRGYLARGISKTPTG